MCVERNELMFPQTVTYWFEFANSSALGQFCPSNWFFSSSEQIHKLDKQKITVHLGTLCLGTS